MLPERFELTQGSCGVWAYGSILLSLPRHERLMLMEISIFSPFEVVRGQWECDDLDWQRAAQVACLIDWAAAYDERRFYVV